jgi:hypothetical protein
MENKKHKNITKEEEKRFEKLNSIHPTKLKPNDKYEFNLLLGKKYLYLSCLKRYTQTEKKFYRDQGHYFVKYAENIRRRHGLKLM